ncbi:hypothetical protein [Leptolyngbya sp. 7M]|uniref:hypothetical protein n=1 Tax=Leptolyngbya sp. 7M TaxID=2812896 RepID=UPI001B8CF393|nr:hypothetical protein [Leptolyngbya sp. 7M]QYO64363.1 hypothetical protein JVX88_32495 [Leptolyngbya sp. 7M]
MTPILPPVTWTRAPGGSELTGIFVVEPWTMEAQPTPLDAMSTHKQTISHRRIISSFGR